MPYVKQGALSAKSHDTVDAVVADERESAALIHSKVHSAKKNVAKVDVKLTADGDETKERSVHIRNFDRLDYFVKSVICDMEQRTKVLHPLLLVASAPMESLKSRAALADLTEAEALSP